MMAELCLMFFEFFKVGLFSIGGGLATLPFLYDLAGKYDWFTPQMVSDMIAVSESTPGPIGVNMATYAGFVNYGVVGALVTTLGLVTPSIIIILVIARFLQSFSDQPAVKKVFSGLRPTVTGLIGAVAVSLAATEMFSAAVWDSQGFAAALFQWKSIILFAVLVVMTRKIQRHPLFYIILAAIVGIVFQF